VQKNRATENEDQAMSKRLLRPFENRDTDAVVEIANLAWQRIYASHRDIFGEKLYAALFPEDRERKGNEMRRHCEHSPDHIWICELDGRVVGFIMWSMDTTRNIGTVGNNGLHPDAAGQGLGTFMYREPTACSMRRYTPGWTRDTRRHDAHTNASASTSGTKPLIIIWNCRHTALFSRILQHWVCNLSAQAAVFPHM
jgi:hypothetical protein